MTRLLTALFCLCLSLGSALADGLIADDALSVTAPTPVQAARIDDGVPGWTASQGGRVVGEIGSTWEIAGSVGYSGRALDVLVAVSPKARITGALLVRHNEPAPTLGISDADIAAHVTGFKGFDLAAPVPDTSVLPPIISRATESSGVIRDGILRTARTLAIGRGLISAGGGVDRLTFTPATWSDLLAMGALTEAGVTMTEASKALTGAKVPIPPGDGDFLHLRAGVIDTPTAGQNLLGQRDFTRAVGNIGAGGAALIVMSQGVRSHRGTDWKKTGTFDRPTVVQGDIRWQPTGDRVQMLRRLALPDAPVMKEISLFALPVESDPTQPLTVEVRATRPTATGEVAMTIDLPSTLPQAFRRAAPRRRTRNRSGNRPGTASTRRSPSSRRC